MKLFNKLKLRVLHYLLKDICKRGKCDYCFFSEMYMEKPVLCKRRDKALLEQARKSWKLEE
jgi:hypothetical protein